MSLLSPWLLLLLLIVPLLLAIYIWMLRRRRKYAVRYSSLALIREALPRRSRWRQHVPVALFLLALTSLLFATARPVALAEVPLNRSTIILALDVSRSMCATDVEPNRLSVAQDAARAFVRDQADGTQMGIVVFADFAEMIVAPTTDKKVLEEAIRTLTTARGTAIGSATLKALDAIAEVNPAVAPSAVNLGLAEGAGAATGLYQPDIIVLLTDGANTRGPAPLDAARQAADRQVRVYTIGFGTTNPSQMICTPAQLGGASFGGGFGGGSFMGGGDIRRYLLIDEPTLEGMAEITGGAYYRAENAAQLLDVFLNLPTQIVLQKQTLEISVVFAALGALLATTAVFLSLWWNRSGL